MPDYFHFQRLILKKPYASGEKKKTKEILINNAHKIDMWSSLCMSLLYVCHLLSWELELQYLGNLFLLNHATFLNYEGENNQSKPS